MKKYLPTVLCAVIALIFFTQAFVIAPVNEDSTNVLLAALIAVSFAVGAVFALPQISAFTAGRYLMVFFSIAGLALLAARVYLVELDDQVDPIVLVGASLVFLLFAVPVVLANLAIFKRVTYSRDWTR